MVGPQQQRRSSSSVASSCVSLEFGDLQEGQSPSRTTNGFQGKSPGASITSSPRTPAAGLDKSGSPSAVKKRRASTGGGADDLARGLDFGTTSPSMEEKKHPFLTRGGGHKKVASPTTPQMISPQGKKATTPPGKEKSVGVRATAVSTLSPRKSVDLAKKDHVSPRRSVLGSEGTTTTNGSLISEGASSLVEVTPKKISPRASLEGKVSAGKPSPRPNMKPVASTKVRKNSNGDLPGIDSSPPAAAETKLSPGKTPDVKIKKTSPQSPVPSLKFRPGLTSPKSQKSAKTRHQTPSQPGRAKTRIEKAVHTEPNLQKPEPDSIAVPVSPEHEIQAAKSEAVVGKMQEDGTTLMPSLMLDGNVGDEDMTSLDQGGDPAGFDHDMEMPTSWLSEDLPCMFSSLSRLPEPDDSNSSHLGDPPEFSDDPFAEETNQNSSELANPEDVVVAAAEVLPRSPVDSPDEEFVAAGFPSEIPKELGESEWNYESKTFALLGDSIESECVHEQPCESNELESKPPSPFPDAVEEPVATVSQGERMPCVVNTTYPGEIASSSNGSTITKSVAPDTSLLLTEDVLSEEQNLQFLSESRSMQPVSSQSDEEPVEVVENQGTVPENLQSNGGVYHFGSSREIDGRCAITSLPEEERWTAAEDEVSATEDHLAIASSDDESSEDFIEGTCGAQLNLKQTFDAAAEPEASHNEVDGTREPRQEDTRLEPMTAEALPTNRETLSEVTKVTESEFTDKSQDGQESGTFQQTHVDKDMMIFDFEEYWTHNAGDESFHSDAGQNDAGELHLESMRETQLPSPVLAEKSVPLHELPAFNLRGDQFMDSETESSHQLGVTQLDSHGWLDSHDWSRTNSSPPIPASSASGMNSKSADQEFDEVFHPFEGPDHLSPKAVLVDDLGSPEKPTVELHQEPLAPISSQFKTASEPDTSSGPRYSSLETEHSNGVHIGQVIQALDVPEDKNVEPPVAEYQKSSFHTSMAQESSVTQDLYSPKIDLVLSDDKAPIHQESLALKEDIDTPPIVPSVTSNGLLGTHIHHLDDKVHISDESVDFEAPEDPDFLQVSSQKSSFETPALADAFLSDESSDTGPANLSVSQELEVRTISVQTAETTDGRETNELLPDAFHASSNRDYIASSIAGTDNSVDSSELKIVERDQKILISSASQEVEPALKSRTTAISLPPMNEISDEEQTEAFFLLSLDSKENSNRNEDSSTVNHELRVEHSQEKTLRRGENIKDPDFLVVVGLLPEPTEKFQDISSESRDSETEGPFHDTKQIQPKAMFQVEERPRDIQSQDDERIMAPARQVESHGETVDVLKVDSKPQVPVILSTPEFLQDDEETPELFPTGDHDESHALGSVPRSPVFDQADEILNHKFDSKSAVDFTASRNESDEGTDTLIAASGATVSDKTSPSEILGKGEASHGTPEATPPTLSAGILSNLTKNEADEFDDKKSEVTVDEERWSVVGDFGDESSTAEHGWEEPPSTTDLSDSKSSTTNLFRQESMVTHAGNSLVADDVNGLEIDTDISEEVFRVISTPDSTPHESIGHPDNVLEELHLLGKAKPTDDQVFRTKDALENVLGASSDAYVDDTNDPTVKDVEIVPEHFSSKDLPLERFFSSNQQMFNDVDEVDSELTRLKEEQSSNQTLAPIPLVKDDDMVENLKNSFVHSSQDTAKCPDVEDREGTSAPPLVTSPPEMNTAGTFAPENILPSSPEQHPTKERVLEDEETVVYRPKNSFVASDTPETVLADTEPHASKEEESFNGFAAQDIKPTNAGSHSIQAASWKDGSQARSSVEKLLHEGEDTAEKLSAISGEDKAIPDVDELEEPSWTSDKEEKESLNETLIRGEETIMVESSKDQIVSSPMSRSDIPDEEAPQTLASEVNCNQNGNSWSGRSLKREPLLEADEDTVVYRPAVEEFTMEKSHPTSVESPMKTSNVPKDTVVCTTSVGDLTPELMEESSRENVETVVDRHVENFNVLEHDAVILVAEEHEAQRGVKERESLNGSFERESKIKVEKNSEESFIASGLLSPIYTSNLNEAEVSEKQSHKEETLDRSFEEKSSLEVEQPVVVERFEESFISPDRQNVANTSNVAVAELVKQTTDKEDEALDRQSQDSDSPFEIEETAVEESSEKESFVAPDFVKAKDVSNLAAAAAEKPQEHSDREEETVDQFLDTNSTFEVEEMAVEESSEKDAKDVSHLISEKQTEKEEKPLDRSLEAEFMNGAVVTVVESSEKESYVAPGLPEVHYTANSVVADQLERQIDKEEETLDQSPEVKSTVEAENDGMPQTFVAPDLLNAKSSKTVIADEFKNRTDKEEENLQEEKPTVEVADTAVQRSKEPLVASDAVAEILDHAENLDKHPAVQNTPSKEGETFDAVTLDEEESIEDKVVDRSNDNVKKELEYLSEEDGSSGPTNMVANLVASNLNLADEGSKEPHSSPIAHDWNSDRVKSSLDVSDVVQKAAVARDLEECKAPAAENESCMTNGEKLEDSNSLDMDVITVPAHIQADSAEPESTEPQSPTATLYPLSKPPFSGSLQDRLWEEQAEAYNSGQGTPSRNDHATPAAGASGVSSTSPKENPTSSEDQIQPVAAATAASNGNHAVIVVGTSTNGAGSHENGSTPVPQDQQKQLSKANGKEKLHTPLRSLLLEESSHAGSLTPNGVSSSPSFIRRLFRVMSTSRSVEKEASQGKLKRSSSMWVSCLGSPQVQQ